jgi:hypothetical protein
MLRGVLKYRRGLASAVSLLALLSEGSAKAETDGAADAVSEAVECTISAVLQPERAREVADELFARGKRLRERGRVAEGCACLDASNQVAKGRGGTLLAVGLCHEQEGKLASAYRELRRASAKARQDGRTDREGMAAEHLAAIEPKLSWLAIAPPANVEAVIISVDGSPVLADEWTTLPLEIGTHVVSASAHGFRERTLSIVVRAAAERLSVRFAPLEPDRAQTEASNAPRVSRSVAAPRSAPARNRPPTLRTSDGALATAALVTGVVGLALSLASGAWALERKGVVRSHCDAQKQCWGPGAAAASTGRVLTVMSTAAFVAGGVGLSAWLLLPGGRLIEGGSPHAAVSVSGEF